MDAPVLIDNKCGVVRGYAEADALYLSVQADTPQHGPVATAFKLSGSMKLLYFYAVMLNLEMQFFSLIARRGEPSGFSALADLGGHFPTEPSPIMPALIPTGIESPARHGLLGRRASVTDSIGPASNHGHAQPGRRAALFEGELTSFRTQSAGGRAGVEIRSTLDTRRLRYRVFFSVLHFETRAVARFDCNVGEIRALKTLAEQALAPRSRIEVVLLDDPNTLSATLVAAGPSLEFALATPYTQKRLAFRDANNLATLSFWCERALAHRGNPLIAFKREPLGLALWEHPDTRLPYARFYLGGPDNEIMNLTRLNLCANKLFSDLALRRAVYRESTVPREQEAVAEAVL